MSNLLQLNELIPIKGIFFRVVDVNGQHQGYPELVVLQPYKQTMGTVKRMLRARGQMKPKSREVGKRG